SKGTNCNWPRASIVRPASSKITWLVQTKFYANLFVQVFGVHGKAHRDSHYFAATGISRFTRNRATEKQQGLGRLNIFGVWLQAFYPTAATVQVCNLCHPNNPS